MDITITTLNEILLPPFLFLLVFCFLCCQIPRYTAETPQPEVSRVVTLQPQDEPQPHEEILSEQFDSITEARLREELEADLWKDPIVEPQADTTEVAAVETAQEVDLKPQQIPLQEPAKVEDAPFSQLEPTLEQLLLGIDLDKLQLRPARKIASRLNIQQKVNGKDQPLGFLRAQIKKQLNEQPQEVAPVIQEVLRAC